MSKIKLLCTGSAGFIFSNFIRYILKNSADYQIISVDKFSTESLNSIYRNKSHIVHIGNITDPHFIDMVFTLEQPDFVIHGAAEYNSPTMVQSNILGTKVIIDACKKHSINKLLFISTYEMPTYSEFAATKAAGELLVQTSGINYNIIRLCENYGPKQPMNNFIPAIINGILNNKPIIINESQTKTRDLIHVQDTCESLLCILKNGKDKEIYEVSADQELTDIEIFQKICSILSRGNELLQTVNNTIEAQPRLNNNNLKELGWTPSFKLKEGLIHTANWYSNNMWFSRK